MEQSSEKEAAAPDPGPEVPPSGSGSRPRGLGGIGSAEALAALGAVGRRLLWLLPVYLAGRAGLSLGFVVAGVALYMGWKGRRLGKERSLRMAGLLLSDEEGAVSAAATTAGLGRSLGKNDLPAWFSKSWSHLLQLLTLFLTLHSLECVHTREVWKEIPTNGDRKDPKQKTCHSAMVISLYLLVSDVSLAR
ncbi:UNVERIFIED_CONTAM: hypothetical protein K2H54_032002 [Gekko kuhli]